MRMCGRHWELLREAIKERGMWHLVEHSGEAVVATMTAGGFEPLMEAHNDLIQHAADIGGREVMFIEGCPVCWCADHHICDDRPCLDPHFDSWIGFAAKHAREHYDRLIGEEPTRD